MRAGRWLAAFAAFAAALAFTGSAQAHGGDVNIGVSCMAPDPARPLSKVCTAVVVYADGDRVTDAKLSLTASRQEGEQRTVAPVSFQPAGEAGVYTAGFDYPAYGKWLTRLEVTEPGSGQAEIREEILPPLPGTPGAAASSARVRIVLDFDERELTNILVRTLHLGAAASWVALSLLVLAASLLLSGSQRETIMRFAARWFPAAVGGSFALLALTGWYNAVYNVPARPPGLFNPEVIGNLPFGSAYLMAFLAKMGLTGAMILATGALAIALRRAYGSPVRPIAGGAAAAFELMGRVDRPVVALAALNVGLGLFIFIDMVVIGYFHILTHIGGITGAR